MYETITLSAATLTFSLTSSAVFFTSEAVSLICLWVSRASLSSLPWTTRIIYIYIWGKENERKWMSNIIDPSSNNEINAWNQMKILNSWCCPLEYIYIYLQGPRSRGGEGSWAPWAVSSYGRAEVGEPGEDSSESHAPLLLFLIDVWMISPSDAKHGEAEPTEEGLVLTGAAYMDGEEAVSFRWAETAKRGVSWWDRYLCGFS